MLVIAANYLSSLEKCLELCGVSHFLEKIGFDLTRVQDPASQLTLMEFTQIIDMAYALSGRDDLGLLFGQSLSIVNHGFLGYAAMSSPTMGTAIQTMLGYLNTRTRLFDIELYEQDGEKVYVQLKMNKINDNRLHRFIIEMAVTHLINMRQFLVNEVGPMPSVELSYEAPDYAMEYDRLWHTNVIFNAPYTRVWFWAKELQYPVSFADDASYQLAKTQLQAFALTLATKDDLPSRIKAILIRDDLHHLTMEEVASKLCMSSRTLRRHLQPFELTYQEVVDEVRLEKAKAFLLNKSMSTTEISFLLGFRDTSNFTKAFKRWTGTTPTDYREQFN